MTSLLAATFAICLRHADTTSAVISCATAEAQHFASRLGLERDITIRVLSVQPKRNALASQWAWARRDKSNLGCQLDFMPDAVRDIETIAHEVCHCRYHFDVMTKSGKVSVEQKVLDRIEREAMSCAREMVR